VSDITYCDVWDHILQTSFVLRNSLGSKRRKLRKVKAMRILIALDATPSCGKVVEEALKRPWPSGSIFFLLHVLDAFRFVKAPISLQVAKGAASAELTNLKKGFVEAGWKAETDVVLGHPRSAIAERAIAWKAELVMLGSNDLGPVARLLFGSTAHSVLRRAACSVEIVRPPKNGKKLRRTAMRILVATDGSEYSVTALRSVASRPWPKGSELKVLSVPEPFVPTNVLPYFESKEIEELNTSALKEATKAVDAGAKILSKLDAKVSTGTPFPQDSPARVIAKEAQEWGAQMIVLGSHGRRGFDRLTMGSVSEHVAFHAHCSVEVIRSRKVQGKRSGRGENQ
jgi:nucleotide-binding universal stress UspA family protein